MADAPSISRTLLAIVLLGGLVVVAGCSTTTDYSTSIDEPTNGTVIDNLSVSHINEMDGAQYDLHYSINESDNTTYNIEIYELTNDPPEFIRRSNLEHREQVHRIDVSTPWDVGEERRYKLQVVRESTGDVVDAVSFSIKKESH